jgi:hypothetical protein
MQGVAGEALFGQVGVHSFQPKLPGAAGFGDPLHIAMAGGEVMAGLFNAGDMVLQARQQGFGVQLLFRLMLEEWNGRLTSGGQAATSRTLEE